MNQFDNYYLILAYQEYDTANHKDLWNIMAEDEKNLVCVLNIPADQIISRVRHKQYRIDEAKKPVRQIKKNLLVGRALFPLRPEIVPECMYSYYARILWNYVDQNFPQMKGNAINVLVYDALWIKLLADSRNDVTYGYFLTDEVRYNAHDNSIRKKAYQLDTYACINSDVVFTMSNKLAESRKELSKNVHFIGNGANLHIADNFGEVRRHRNSVAFIGNFRDWIDKELYEELIKSRPDLDFFIVGSVEPNMQTYLDHLLCTYLNTYYHGRIGKKDMGYAYRSFDVVLIPYVQNEFIMSSRPLKIVESVISGTPVVSVPVNGYTPCSFIRFAKTASEFSKQIDEIMVMGDIKNQKEYNEFVSCNTWQYLAKKIMGLYSNVK